MLHKIHHSYLNDVNLQHLVQELQAHPNLHPHYTWTTNELRRKGRLVIGNNIDLRQDILKWLHSSLFGGHSGINASLHRIKALFLLEGYE